MKRNGNGNGNEVMVCMYGCMFLKKNTYKTNGKSSKKNSSNQVF